MGTPEFEVGEQVRLGDFPLVRVAATTGVDCGELAVVLDCDAGTFPLVIPLGVVPVTRVAFGHWPPQPGDLWRDSRANLWFASDVHNVDETDVPDIQLVCAYEGQSPAALDAAARMYGPFTLVHRDAPPATPQAAPTMRDLLGQRPGRSFTVPAWRGDETWNGGQPVTLADAYWLSDDPNEDMIAVRWQDALARRPAVVEHVAADRPIVFIGGSDD